MTKSIGMTRQARSQLIGKLDRGADDPRVTPATRRLVERSARNLRALQERDA